MSSKVANLIALELGVLIALLAWLAFSNLRSVKQQPIAQQTARTVDSFGTVAPLLKPKDRSRQPVDYRADLPAEEPQEEQPPPVVQQYDQSVAREPYPSSSLDDGYIAETSPYYNAVEPEPVLTSPDCFFSPADQFFVYPQSIIIVSNSRFPRQRSRSPARPGSPGTTVTHPAPPMVAHRHPPMTTSQSQVPNGTVGPRRNTPVQSSRPSPRVRPRQIP